ncbi:MAG: tail fiber domain-containing protein [Prevotella sp.]|nr:tail fiber domain-containing protein [Prevotella sp.]
MKKLFFTMLLMLTPVFLFAQLTVFTNNSGNVSIKTSAENPYAYLMVTPSTYTDYYGYNMATLSNSTINSGFNVGVSATAMSSSILNYGRTFGLYGLGGNCTSGYNYGVYGILFGSNNGSAIVGSLNTQMGIYIPGRYAGYFDGTTMVDGTLYATNVVSSSDDRLKENIINMTDIEDGSTTLENIQRMNVIEYNFKEINYIPDAEKDTIKTKVKREDEELYTDRHYGLSAQELQAIYPNLVKERQDGYLGVNYIELVPILIRSIQELKQELDKIKGSDYSRLSISKSDTTSSDAIGSNSGDVQQSFNLQGIRVKGDNRQQVSTCGDRRLVLK